MSGHTCIWWPDRALRPVSASHSSYIYLTVTWVMSWLTWVWWPGRALGPVPASHSSCFYLSVAWVMSWLTWVWWPGRALGPVPASHSSCIYLSVTWVMSWLTWVWWPGRALGPVSAVHTVPGIGSRSGPRTGATPLMLRLPVNINKSSLVHQQRSIKSDGKVQMVFSAYRHNLFCYM